MQRVEIGISVHAQDHGLTVEHELLLPVLQGGFSDPGEALGPVIPATRDQSRAAAVALDAEAT